MLLSKEQIFACKDVDTKEVDMKPFWPGSVRIKAMSIGDQIEFERINKKRTDQSDAVVTLLLFCCVDEAGSRLFSEADLKELNKKSYRAIERLFRECLNFNSLSEKALEEQAKNS